MAAFVLNYSKYLESITPFEMEAYHGSITLLPFSNFSPNIKGMQPRINGNHKSFYFTDSFENSTFYADNFVCRVSISDVEIYECSKWTRPSEIGDIAYEKKKNYVLKDILDGIAYSDVIIVPFNNLQTIKILEWIFVGDEEIYFKNLNELLSDDIDTAEDVIGMMGLDLSYLMEIPIFKKYWTTTYL